MSGGKECFYDLFDDSDIDDEISSFIKDFVPEKKAPAKDIKPNHKLSAKDVKAEPKTKLTAKEFKPEIKRNLPAKDIKSDPKQKPTAKDAKPDPIQKATAKDVKPDPIQKATAKDVKPDPIQKQPAKPEVKDRNAKDIPMPIKEEKKMVPKNVLNEQVTSIYVSSALKQNSNAEDVKLEHEKQPAKDIKSETKQQVSSKDIPSLLKEEKKVLPKTIPNELVSSNNVSSEPKQKISAKDVKLEPKEKQPAKNVKPETKHNIPAIDIPSPMNEEKKITPKSTANKQINSNNVSSVKGSTTLDNCEKKDLEQNCEDLKNRVDISGKQEQKNFKNKTEIITKVNDDQKLTVMEVSKNEENKSDKSSKENSKSSSKDLLVNDDLESLLNEKCEAESNDSHLSPISSVDSMSLDNTELEKEIQHFLGKKVETQSTDKVKSSLDKKVESKSVSEIKPLKGILKKQGSSSHAKGDEANLHLARQDDEKQKPVEKDCIKQKLESSGPDSHKKENEEKYKADEGNNIKKNAESTDSDKKQQNDGKHKAEERDSRKRKTESSDIDYQKKQNDTKRKKEESDSSHKKKEDKRKAESNIEENDSKKRKTESSAESVAYNKTITTKMVQISEKFRKLNSYLNYRVRRGKRLVDFEIVDIRECPPDERTSAVYGFVIGSDIYTNELSIGWKVKPADSDQPKVMRVSDEELYLSNKITDLIKVFKKMIQAHERGRVDGVKKIWKDLYIYINRRQELMLNVIVFFSTSIVKEIHSLLVDFFKSGEGKKFQVTSVYVTCYYKMDGREELISELVMGKSYFELLHGLNVQFAVCVENWSSLYGLKMMCQGVEELLAPTRNTCIMDIFCGSGFLGFYLSKISGKILAYDDVEVIRISKKNANHNDITGIQYFSGNSDDIEYEARRSKYDELTAVVNWNSASNHELTINQVAETLRKITRLNKLVLIVNSEAVTDIPFRALCDPDEPGRPFVMAMVIPFDTMPFQSEYTLAMLFVRNSEVHGKFVPSQGLYRASKPNVKDYWWNWIYEVDDTRTKQKEGEFKSRKEEEMKRKLRKQLERKRKEEEEEMKQKMEEERKRKLQEELVRKKQEELERIRIEEEEQRKKEEEERQKKEKEKRLTFFKKRLRVEQLRRAQGDQKNDGEKEQCKEEDNEAKKKKEMGEQKKQAQKAEKKKQPVTEKKNETLEQLRRQIEEEKVRAKRNAERRKQQYEERQRKAEEEEHWRMQQPRIPVWVEPPTAHVDLMMEEQMRIMIEEERRKRLEDEEYRRRLEEEAYRTVETETVVFDYNHGSSKQEKEDLDKPMSSVNVAAVNPVSYPIPNKDPATAASAGAASNTVSRPVMKWLEKLREVSGDTDASKAPYVKDASPQKKSSDPPPSLLSLKVEKPSSLCEPKMSAESTSKIPQNQQLLGKSSASINPWLKTPGYFGSPLMDQTSGAKIDSDACASQKIDQRSSASGLGNMFGPNSMTSCKDQWTSGSSFYGASTTSNTSLGAVEQKKYGSNFKNMYREASSGSVDHRLSSSNYSSMYGTGAASASASGLNQRISGSHVSNVFGATPNFNSPTDYANVHRIDQRSTGSSFNNYYGVPDSVNKGSSSHLNSSKLCGSTGGPTVTADPRGLPGLLGPAPSMSNAYGRHDHFSNLPNPSNRFDYGLGSDNQQQSLSGLNERNIGTYGSHSGRQLDNYNTGGTYNYAGGELDWNNRNVASERDLSEDNFSFRKAFNESRNVGSSYLGKP